MAGLEELYQSVIDGDEDASRAITKQALDEGADALSIVTGHMVPAMDEAGQRFESGEFFVPELLLSARAMKAAMALIRPVLVETGVPPSGKVVLGTVQGDLHDIGKNLVAAMLEGGGFEVYDLGVDVQPGQFVEAILKHDADVLGLSALLTTTMPLMKAVIEALEDAGIRERVKVMIGGAPVSDRYKKEIGADGYGENAIRAVEMAREFVSSGSG